MPFIIPPASGFIIPPPASILGVPASLAFGAPPLGFCLGALELEDGDEAAPPVSGLAAEPESPPLEDAVPVSGLAASATGAPASPE